MIIESKIAIGFWATIAVFGIIFAVIVGGYE